jgi:hypothetical protein
MRRQGSDGQGLINVQPCCCSLQSRQRRVQGTASNRAGEMGRLQVSHTPNACRFMRANASSIARRSRLSVWWKWTWRSA